MTVVPLDLDTPVATALAPHKPCHEARKWFTGLTLRQAWETCEHPDWMLWALNALGNRDARLDRLFACRCVRETPLADGRTVWNLLTDPRSRRAVEVSERFADGLASGTERSAAAAAAAAAAANAAAAAAWSAAAADDTAVDSIPAAFRTQANILRDVYASVVDLSDTRRLERLT